MAFDLLWYVAYGSNLNGDRFAVYLRGGRPDGAGRTYSGCRDTSPPRGSAAWRIAGQVSFAGQASVWGGGGVAFLDPSADGRVAVRGYLITPQQFADVAAQEVDRAVGTVAVDVEGLHRDGRHSYGPGWYETLHLLGDRDGIPMLTFTSAQPPPSPGLALNAPSAAYLRTIASGLVEAHGMSLADAGAYLAVLPGAAGTWTPAGIAALLG